MADEHVPIVEELLRRVGELETRVNELSGHTHQVNTFGSNHTTRPVGFGSKKELGP